MFLLTALALALSAQTPDQRSIYIPYDDARPILEAFSEELPAELKAKSPADLRFAWPKWVARRDAEIRARLIQGDEDSLVNFLLFGTSYTRQPRITQKELMRLGIEEKLTTTDVSRATKSLINNIIQARVDDLARSLAAPEGNERLLFLRHLVEQKGYQPNTEAGRARLKEYILSSLVRVLNEQESYAKALEGARLLGDPSEEFAERSTLYRARGLSVDTSLLPNFAIEKSLEAMRDRHLLGAGSARRVAIVGPGLDFTDKQAGYDFYPQQTIQPFALIDTLLRLGLARADALQVNTFDISPRVNDHLIRARQRAQLGEPYVVQLPLDSQVRWKPETTRYWERFGDQIGVSVPPVAIPAGTGELKLRAVRIRPAVVLRIMPVDLNVVLQRLEVPAKEKYDLIIATNILVYYDTFEQSLALANVARMLRPGGFLLSNHALLELCVHARCCAKTDGQQRNSAADTG